MPEIVVLGQIIGATDFDDDGALMCKWEIVTSDDWTVVRGETAGKTHLVDAGDEELFVWCHPLETHYSTSSIAGWPQISVQVWRLDEHKRAEIAGYGCTRLPVVPGMHELELVTWAPEGGWMDRLAACLLDAKPQLTHPEVVYDTNVDRCELNTVTRGVVHLEVQILAKGFDKHGVTFNDAPSGEVAKRSAQ